MKTIQEFRILMLFGCLLALSIQGRSQSDTLRTMQYTSRSPADAKAWQEDVRRQLFAMLQLDPLLGLKSKIAFKPQVLLKEDHDEYILKEVEFNSTPSRRIVVILTLPKSSKGPFPAVVSIHGHGGTKRIVYEKASLYKGFADELARNNYVTIAPFVSQHEVYEDNMILMGERLWDCIRCIDYLETLPEVDPERMGCAGLSLGGEMTMWLGGMDTRMKATISCGFLTKMDHMEVNHCMCWKFPGLRTLVDYADIYALTAPRALQFQNGLKEPPSQFPVELAKEALKEIEPIYKDLSYPENVGLHIHPGGHEVDVAAVLSFMDLNLKN